MLLSEGKHYTLADALTWSEQDHIELIDGAPVQMAFPLTIHQEVRMNLGIQLANYAQGKTCHVYFVPLAVRLFEREGDRPEDVDTMVVPDIIVVCDPAKLDDIGCKGAPDLVIEILSPDNRRHDRLVKLRLYQRARVREYWIVNPDEKTVQVFLLDGNGSLCIHEEYERDDLAKVNVLDGCYVDLCKVFSE